MDASAIYQAVDATYSSIASQAQARSNQPPTAQPQYVQIARSFGYSANDLALLPTGANFGLSCGNPLATAHLQPSETMVDLGSGGGLDCLIAARQMLQADAAPTGKVVGVDRSESMIGLARQNLQRADLPAGLVEFIHAPISEIPLETASVDVVVSNCVINLVPDQDKPRVFREIYRLLKPGGRVAISDLLAKKPMPDHIRQDAALLVGCVAGASLVQDYRRWIADAGFHDDGMAVVDTGKDLNVYHGQDGPSPSPCCKSGVAEEGTGRGGSSVDFNAWVASYQIYAVK
ncbi:hypothetical protein A1O3_07633 [Capronia epimyces CBS 606.96]|uniref:Arsenite methyltransferase n=1 Tax=Capronia epimyces CBS 606.96 TaxID=1182542 RepID=W9XMD2_9EURO|nr:uncharacterized protein A1O3_07633 [Capronia epimyces CBS 606.96]EXJ81343.1 hypothetical protein A1O3_07633 [Capronia epimyces CBS 606.96]